MLKQSNLRGRGINHSKESLEPMLGYCSKIIKELQDEDFSELTMDMLAEMRDFRPILKEGKKSSPLLVELMDWKIRNHS